MFFANFNILIEPPTIEGQEEEETQQGSSQIVTNAIKQNGFLLDLEEESLSITGNLELNNITLNYSNDDIVPSFGNVKAEKHRRAM